MTFKSKLKHFHVSFRILIRAYFAAPYEEALGPPMSKDDQFWLWSRLNFHLRQNVLYNLSITIRKRGFICCFGHLIRV